MMTPPSYYSDLDRFYHICIKSDKPRSPVISAGLARIMAIAEEIARRAPDRFVYQAEVIFMTMAYSILVTVAAGETVSASSIEGCIRAYTEDPKDKPMEQEPPPAAKETQYCRRLCGPCRHCVDMYRSCRNFYGTG